MGLDCLEATALEEPVAAWGLALPTLTLAAFSLGVWCSRLCSATSSRPGATPRVLSLPVTLTSWARLTRVLLRIAYRRRLWAFLGQRLNESRVQSERPSRRELKGVGGRATRR